MPDIAELKTKHLEMIESNISRMAGYSASLKNYCLTLLTATGGFALTSKSSSIMLLGFLAIFFFALLDTEYLKLEKRYRSLYEIVRTQEWSVMPSFQMDVSSHNGVSFGSALRSWSIGAFYIPLCLGVALIIVFLEINNG